MRLQPLLLQPISQQIDDGNEHRIPTIRFLQMNSQSQPIVRTKRVLLCGPAARRNPTSGELHFTALQKLLHQGIDRHYTQARRLSCLRLRYDTPELQRRAQQLQISAAQIIPIHFSTFLLKNLYKVILISVLPFVKKATKNAPLVFLKSIDIYGRKQTRM